LNRCSEKSRQSVDVPLDELYNYFKEMNEVKNDDIEIVINLNEDNHDDVLNVPISQAEIKNVILSPSEDMCYSTNTPTYRNYTFIKNKVKQFRMYWNHKIHSIF
jgi:hypothetical protein